MKTKYRKITERKVWSYRIRKSLKIYDVKLFKFQREVLIDFCVYSSKNALNYVPFIPVVQPPSNPNPFRFMEGISDE